MAYLNSYTQNEGKKRGGGTNDPKIRIVTCIHIHSMRISCRGREKGGTGGGVLTIQIFRYCKVIKIHRSCTYRLSQQPPTLSQSTIFFKPFPVKKNKNSGPA